jgi:hypothetical protein
MNNRFNKLSPGLVWFTVKAVFCVPDEGPELAAAGHHLPVDQPNAPSAPFVSGIIGF